MKAHDNSLQPGDWIEFKIDGFENIGVLEQILDCVYGTVKIPHATLTIPLADARLMHRQEPDEPDICLDHEIDY
jgi:hypothetical protein